MQLQTPATNRRGTQALTHSAVMADNGAEALLRAPELLGGPAQRVGRGEPPIEFSQNGFAGARASDGQNCSVVQPNRVGRGHDPLSSLLSLQVLEGP